MAIFNYREILRQRLVEQEYARAMQQQVISNVTVTPGEVEKFFNEMKEEERPLVPEQYVYAQIVRYPASQEDAKRRTRERLLEMRERIISGKSSMAVLARTYSLDPGSAMRGGELTPGPLSQLTKPFADALAKLKPGQISEVVESEFGFHIIELIEEPKNNMYRSRHILLKPSYTIEEQVEPTQYLDSLVTFIRNDSIAFDVAAKDHSQDDLSKMNGGLVSNHDLLMSNPAFANVQYTQTKFRREDFGSGKNLNDYMNLIKLKPGEVSGAFISEDVKGNPISKIVKLLEIIPTHSASLNEDYLTIEEMALEDKKYKHFEKWLKSKIDEIYVYVDPDFRDGEFMYKNWIK
jgi:peptidyl-prolyl cis-trans isomerase SurA